MNLVWAAVLVAAVDAELVVADHVDLVEVNHLCNVNDGMIVFEQVIWWDFNFGEHGGRYEVVDWRLLTGVRQPPDEATVNRWRSDLADGVKHGLPPVGRWLGGHAMPRKTRSGTYMSEWWDEKTNTRRRVTADVLRHSWSCTDPELQDRDLLPQERRRRLRNRRESPW